VAISGPIEQRRIKHGPAAQRCAGWRRDSL